MVQVIRQETLYFLINDVILKKRNINNRNMNKKLFVAIIIIILSFFIFFLVNDKDKGPSPEEIAKNWVTNSATYSFDGSNLKLLNTQTNTEKDFYIFTFSFDSSHGGYGDRTNLITTQVITPHNIEIIMKDKVVESAITDNVYDEIKQKMINEEIEEKKISVYFLNINGEQEELTEVKRSISQASPSLAISELLNGPTLEESDRGIFSMINPGTIMNDLSVENNIARIDFNQKLEEGIAGSATVMAIRNQIEKTLLQFDEIEEVIISINGDSEMILQP